MAKANSSSSSSSGLPVKVVNPYQFRDSKTTDKLNCQKPFSFAITRNVIIALVLLITLLYFVTHSYYLVHHDEALTADHHDSSELLHAIKDRRSTSVFQLRGKSNHPIIGIPEQHILDTINKVNSEMKSLSEIDQKSLSDEADYRDHVNKMIVKSQSALIADAHESKGDPDVSMGDQDVSNQYQHIIKDKPLDEQENEPAAVVPPMIEVVKEDQPAAVVPPMIEVVKEDQPAAVVPPMIEDVKEDQHAAVVPPMIEDVKEDQHAAVVPPMLEVVKEDQPAAVELSKDIFLDASKYGVEENKAFAEDIFKAKRAAVPDEPPAAIQLLSGSSHFVAETSSEDVGALRLPRLKPILHEDGHSLVDFNNEHRSKLHGPAADRAIVPDVAAEHEHWDQQLNGIIIHDHQDPLNGPNHPGAQISSELEANTLDRPPFSHQELVHDPAAFLSNRKHVSEAAADQAMDLAMKKSQEDVELMVHLQKISLQEHTAQEQSTDLSKRISSFDLPEQVTKTILEQASHLSQSGVAALNTEAVQLKINYCSGNVDPFSSTPVDKFVVPSSASFESSQQWASELSKVLKSIAKLRIGGSELRAIMKEEVDKLKLLRFQLFCAYA